MDSQKCGYSRILHAIELMFLYYVKLGKYLKRKVNLSLANSLAKAGSLENAAIHE